MSTIKKIIAREILDSRGQPTVEAEVYLASGDMGRAAVPSGASTGSKEAIEKRDGDANYYFGKGVRKAVEGINHHLAPALIGFQATAQQEIDELLIRLDGTLNKEKYGANALLAVSLAAAKAGAAASGLPFYAYLSTDQQFTLPMPMMNIINGGAHADNNLDFQEFMIIPIGAPTFADSLRCGAEIFHHLKRLLKAKGYQTNVGDEGGFAPDLPSQRAAFDLISEAVLQAGYHLQKDVGFALDIASNELYQGGHYRVFDMKSPLTPPQFADYLAGYAADYPILSIEDGMAENDWAGWKFLTDRLGQQLQLVGDDLFVTNTALLQKGIDEKIANAILIKPNQIGTLSETLAAIALAKAANYKTIISHRSGETEDTSIADIAVGTAANQIKTGSLSRTDRIAKYNQLLRIEAALGAQAHFAGREIFAAR